MHSKRSIGDRLNDLQCCWHGSNRQMCRRIDYPLLNFSKTTRRFCDVINRVIFLVVHYHHRRSSPPPHPISLQSQVSRSFAPFITTSKYARDCSYLVSYKFNCTSRTVPQSLCAIAVCPGMIMIVGLACRNAQLTNVHKSKNWFWILNTVRRR